MTDFKPVTRYEVALPVLKAGHLIHAGPDFSKGYVQIVTVRHNPKKVALTGAKTTLVDLTIGTLTSYESLHGNLKKNRVVHIQYIGVSESTITSELWWLTQPLHSKDVEESIDSVRAPVDAPLTVDRWSYDDSQYLRVKQSGTQYYYFKIVEYEVGPFEGKPDRPFLHVFANGQAQFVEAGASVAGLGAYERKVLAEMAKIKAKARA